jgi:hypothetical protein
VAVTALLASIYLWNLYRTMVRDAR